MKKTEFVTTSIEQVTHIVCDACLREEDVDGFEAQEFTNINFTGGFASVFGDMVNINADICQHCLKMRLGDVLIPTSVI